MKSVMSHTFSQIPKSKISRSSFDRSFGHKTTFNANGLVPVYVDEALPGDTFNLNMTTFCRMATPIVPIMDNLYLDSFFFAVPYRIVWDNFERFMGAQTDPGDSTDYLIPQVTMPVGGYQSQSLGDYMGLPTLVEGIRHSALWFRAYNLIWNTWFRDENLQDSRPVPLDDGPDSYLDYPNLKRGKRHDYFTSCLPWPQKGEDVTLPLGTSAPVVSDASVITLGGAPGESFDAGIAPTSNALYAPGATVSTAAFFGDNTGLEVDLTDATSATINDLRTSFAIQTLYERDARGGTRYKEIILSHFNTESLDSRLDRPEYLGGGSQAIHMNVVPQNSATDATATPQGNLAAFGTSSSTGKGFTKSFTEHCLLIGLVNVRSDLTYQQGMDRMWSRKTKFDFYWPSFAHLGEQAVLQKEIYATGVPAEDDLVFGYQERYGEMRYKNSIISGDFRSNDAQSLDYWHLSQDFSAAPVLNSSFIEVDVPMDRVVATPDEPDFLFDSYFSIKCARPMPLYSVPGVVNHF